MPGRVSFDGFTGRFLVGDVPVSLTALHAPFDWMPGAALSGYEVEVIGYGRYRYERIGASAEPGLLPDHFAITYNGKPWPPLPDLEIGRVRGATQRVEVTLPDGGTVAFDLPAEGLICPPRD